MGTRSSHAYGAAFDNPDLIVACIVGDGEAETGPLATGWHSNKFLSAPARWLRAADPSSQRLQIANPCFLARIPNDELRKLFEGYGYKPYFVEGHEPRTMHQQMAGTLDAAVADIKNIQADARGKGFSERPIWPMIIFRTPKGWTCPP